MATARLLVLPIEHLPAIVQIGGWRFPGFEQRAEPVSPRTKPHPSAAHARRGRT
jgi:hypothetical protein